MEANPEADTCTATVIEGTVGESDARSAMDDSIMLGCQVEINGLQNSTEFNGAVGVVQSWDEDRCRWEIRFQRGNTKWLKPANLVPRAAGSVLETSQNDGADSMESHSEVVLSNHELGLPELPPELEELLAAPPASPDAEAMGSDSLTQSVSQPFAMPMVRPVDLMAVVEVVKKVFLEAEKAAAQSEKASNLCHRAEVLWAKIRKKHYGPSFRGKPVKGSGGESGTPPKRRRLNGSQRDRRYSYSGSE